jgi:hypothetical protein
MWSMHGQQLSGLSRERKTPDAFDFKDVVTKKINTKSLIKSINVQRKMWYSEKQ